MEKKYFWINFKGQCDNKTDINIFVHSGINDEQAKRLEEAFEGYITEWGNDNNGDYEAFDYYDGIREAFGAIGVQYEYPQIDYTIYV